MEEGSSHQRQQGQQHSGEDETNADGFQVETQEPLVQRSSKSSTALPQAFSMNSLALMKSGSKATAKQMKFCYMLISQDPTLPLCFLSG